LEQLEQSQHHAQGVGGQATQDLLKGPFAVGEGSQLLLFWV